MPQYLPLRPLAVVLCCVAVLFSSLSLNIADLYAQQGTIATRIYSIALNPAGDKTAVGYGSGLIEIIPINGQQQTIQLVGHSSLISSLAWSSTGNSLASAALNPDNSLRVWDTITGIQTSILTNVGFDVLTVSWKFDDSQILAIAAEQFGDSNANSVLFNPATNTESLLSLPSLVDIAWSPDNAKIALLGTGRVNIYDSSLTQSLTEYQIPSRTVAQRDHFVGFPFTLDWSNDGLQIAVGFGDGRVLILNAITMQPLNWVEANDYAGSTIEFAAVHAIRYDSQNRLVTVSGDGTLTVWNSINWAVLQTTQVAQNYTADFGFSDHTLALGLATTSESPVELVSLSTLTTTLTLPGRTQAVPNASYVVPLVASLYQGAGFISTSGTISTTTAGAFALPNIPQGTYTLYVKPSQFLAVKADVNLNAPTVNFTFTTLKAGDANNDNTVTIDDFTILSNSFGKTVGQAGYDARADFDGNNLINVNDYSLLATYFGQSGEQPPGTNAIMSSPQTAPTGDAALVLSPSRTTVQAGETFEINVQVRRTLASVDAVELHLAFDPALLQVEAITPSRFLPYVLQTRYNNTAGTIDYAAGALEEIPAGRFNTVTIRFRAVLPSEGATLAVNDANVTFGGVSVYGGATVIGVSVTPATTP